MRVTDDSRAHSASWSSSGDGLEKMLGLKLLQMHGRVPEQLGNHLGLATGAGDD